MKFTGEVEPVHMFMPLNSKLYATTIFNNPVVAIILSGDFSTAA